MSATISIPAKAALRTGLYLIWQAVRHPLSSVTFELSSDPPPALPRDAHGRFTKPSGLPSGTLTDDTPAP